MPYIRSIVVCNFGPFKDEQRIEFPKESGVSIIYGENMRGKTTLLNAIRYALFGKIIMRGAMQGALHQLGNWEAAKESGQFGFKVVLEFEHEGSRYELTRANSPRPGVRVPQSDLDYVEECFLRRDGVVLGPDARDTELSRIMPEAVSRFFLFDGELLQQYEELLRNESDMGRSIKESIERILGLPVLTNGRADLAELAREAQKREAKAAQKNQKTQSLGNQHEALLVQRDGLQAETERLRLAVEALRDRKVSQENLLKKTERTRALLEERSRLMAEIERLDERLQEKQDRRKDLLSVAWKGLLVGRTRELRNELETEAGTLRDAYRASVVASELADRLRRALEDNACSTCGQPLSGAARLTLEAQVLSVIPEVGRVELQSNLQRLEARLVGLRQSQMISNADLLQEVQDAIDEIRIEKAAAEDRLAEVRDSTKDLDEAAIRKLYTDFEESVSEIGILQDGIKRQEQAQREIVDAIERVELEIARVADADLEAEQARKVLCEKLKNLFAASVDAYRDRLRDRVERDATLLFRKLTTEEEYAGLNINENYGLTIVHQDGSTIPVRSAGAEHIVALSLMGALQRNAPLRGPIIMDSPFGRLDHAHTTKVIDALPSIAEQVLLLVYESELDPKQARQQLQGKLRKEYRLARRSARYSVIESVS